jgi:endo-1,4-beta-xylanase
MKMTNRFGRLLAAAVMAAFALSLAASQLAFAQSANFGRDNTLRHEAAKLGLHIGSAVNDTALNADATYAQILGQQFSAITPENEMKWASVEATRGVLTFGPADDEVKFAEQHHMLVRGHNLVWQNQLPNWVTSGTFTNAQLADILKQHIFTEVGHFRGKIWQWDVVNEPLNEDGTLEATIWEKALGPNYIAEALTWAHEADPRAKLFINDFNVEGLGAKSDGMFALVKSLKAQHVPIDGVGLESHLSLQFSLPSQIQANMQRFAQLRLDVDVTEADVRFVLPVEPAGQE